MELVELFEPVDLVCGLDRKLGSVEVSGVGAEGLVSIISRPSPLLSFKVKVLK